MHRNVPANRVKAVNFFPYFPTQPALRLRRSDAGISKCENSFMPLLRAFRADVSALLAEAPRVLWLLFALHALEAFAYFCTALNLTLYASAPRFALGDTQAGALYGAWGVSMGVWAFAAGPLIDRLGVRNSLVLGGCFSALGRAAAAAAQNSGQLLVALFVLQAAGSALSAPVISIGARRLVKTPRLLTVAFGLLYSAMNASSLLAGLGADGGCRTGAAAPVAPAYARVRSYRCVKCAIVRGSWIGRCIGTAHVAGRRNFGSVYRAGRLVCFAPGFELTPGFARKRRGPRGRQPPYAALVSKCLLRLCILAHCVFQRGAVWRRLGVSPRGQHAAQVFAPHAGRRRALRRRVRH